MPHIHDNFVYYFSHFNLSPHSGCCWFLLCVCVFSTYLVSDLFVTQIGSQLVNESLNFLPKQVTRSQSWLVFFIHPHVSCADRNALLWTASRKSPSWRHEMLSDLVLHLGHQLQLVGVRQLFESLLKLKHVWELNQPIQTWWRTMHISLQMQLSAHRLFSHSCIISRYILYLVST